MPITLQCTCGADIRLPDTAAGRKARCRTCGGIFTVPEVSVRAEPQPSRPPKPSPSQDADVPWLPDFLEEGDELSAGPPAGNPEAGAADGMTTESSREDEAEPRKGRLLTWLEGDYRPSEDASDGSSHASRGFWPALGGSFLFFLDPGNFTTLLVIWFVHILSGLLGHVFFLFAIIGNILVLGYICAFYMATILHTASGEDDLPTLWFGSILEGLIWPLVQFVGSFAFVLLPALALIIGMGMAEQPVPWNGVRALVVVGLVFWPVVILGVAIGGSFRGLWPYIIIRTALAAPLAYTAVCAVVLLAAAVRFLPGVVLALPGGPVLGFWQLVVASGALSAYTGIVAMRVIGLFYRHHKAKFPWQAE